MFSAHASKLIQWVKVADFILGLTAVAITNVMIFRARALSCSWSVLSATSVSSSSRRRCLAI